MLIWEARIIFKDGQLSATFLIYIPDAKLIPPQADGINLMYVYLHNVMSSQTAPIGQKRMRRPHGAAILPLGAVTVDQNSIQDLHSDSIAADSFNRAPYPTGMRVILILSVLSWMMVALAVAWADRSF